MLKYIGSQDYFNNLSVTLTGIIIEGILFVILIRIFFWINDYKENRFKKYHGISILFHIYNRTLDQFAILFDFDLIVLKGNSNSNNILKYYFTHSAELKVNYENSHYYGNLKTKLYCIEHYCNNNKSITKNHEKILTAIESLNKELEFVDKSTFIDINNKMITLQLKAIRSLNNTLNRGLSDFLSYSAEPKPTEEELINMIHEITMLMMLSFYKDIRFYINYSVVESLKEELFLKENNYSRDEAMEEFYKLESKNNKRLEFWNDLFQLWQLIKRRKSKNTPNLKTK